MSGNVTVILADQVAVIEMNKPPANYLDCETLGEIADRASDVHRDGARAIVLCSQGRHFCAGADFGGGALAGAGREQAAALLYQAGVRIFEIPVPVIAAVQGSAVGGGLGLACAADFRVASPSTRFHPNFSMLGFHQGFALSVSLPAIVGFQQAMDLLYCSRRVGGARAVEIGLADRLVPDGSERAEAIRWAREIAAAAPLAVQSMKATLRGSLARQARAVLERELSEQARLWTTEDSVTGIAANLARETPSFDGR